MRREMLEALKALSVGNIKKAKMNIEIYLKSPVGIGEHPDLVAAVDHEVCKLANAEDKLSSLNNNYST